MILIFGCAVDTLAMEAREERSRASPVKALVVIEDAKPQELTSSLGRNLQQPELLRIKGAAHCVKVWNEGYIEKASPESGCVC